MVLQDLPLFWVEGWYPLIFLDRNILISCNSTETLLKNLKVSRWFISLSSDAIDKINAEFVECWIQFFSNDTDQFLRCMFFQCYSEQNTRYHRAILQPLTLLRMFF